jgi:hypothetical protein
MMRSLPHVAPIVALALATACVGGGSPSPSLEPSQLPSLASATVSGTAPAVSPRVTPTLTAAVTAAIRSLDLAAIVAVPIAGRFEAFGSEPIHLERAWSPRDLGLGGTCADATAPVAWLECGNADWMFQPAADWRGPALEVFFEPGLRERLGRDLWLGEGPLDVVGHFGDPAAERCAAADVDACRDRFVATAIGAE